jgi:hypothetical protein
MWIILLRSVLVADEGMFHAAGAIAGRRRADVAGPCGRRKLRRDPGAGLGPTAAAALGRSARDRRRPPRRARNDGALAAAVPQRPVPALHGQRRRLRQRLRKVRLRSEGSGGRRGMEAAVTGPHAAIDTILAPDRDTAVM